MTGVVGGFYSLALALALFSLAGSTSGWAARWWAAATVFFGVTTFCRGVGDGTLYQSLEAPVIAIAAWCVWRGSGGGRPFIHVRSIVSILAIAGLALGVVAAAIQPTIGRMLAAGLLIASAVLQARNRTLTTVDAVTLALLFFWAGLLVAVSFVSLPSEMENWRYTLPNLLALALLMSIVTHRLAGLQRDAMIDELTGIANRRAFNVAMAATLGECRRRARSAAIVLLDVDRFKALNDRFGHATGDRALVSLATALHRAVRINDMVARIGGDEFALLFVDIKPEELGIVVRRLNAAIAGMDRVGDTALNASMGATSISAGDDDAAAILARADEALIAEKRRRHAR